MQMKLDLKPGSIVLISFDSSLGHEIQKVRPALVFQNDKACEHSPLLTVMPLTSRPFKNRIFEVSIKKSVKNGLLTDSVLLVNQLMTFDRRRIVKHLGILEQSYFQEIYYKLDVHFGRV